MPQSFEWVHAIPGFKLLPAHLSHTIIVMCFLVPLVWIVSRKLRSEDLDVVPPKRFGAMAFFEMAYEAIMGLASGVLGHDAPRFMFLIGGLAVYILFSNLLGIIPGLAPPTDNVNTTAACALTVFFATHYYGLKAQGLSYLKHFVGPSIWLAPLMIPIEIIGHCARPLSLSLRLFGNMFGDHIVLAVFTFMTVSLTKFLLAKGSFALVFTPISVLIPFVVVCLGIFVAVVQTLVFILLTMSYLAGAVAEHH
jgi:F-type H+-transporting ATPase subunit a